jgi:hypothetical protein
VCDEIVWHQKSVGIATEISFIRDYRYVRYVVDDAELVLTPDAAPPGEGIAHG